MYAGAADRSGLVIRGLRLLLAALAMGALVEYSYALDPPYLEGWPTAERVLQDTAGKDEFDTMARQMAALELLRKGVENLAGPRLWRGLNPDEERLRGEYWAASKKIEEVAKNRLSNELGPGFHGPFAKAPLREWYDLQWEYETDPEFRAATLGRYLPPPLLRQLEVQQPATETGRTGTGERKGFPVALAAMIAIVGFVLLALVVRTWRRRSARAVALSALAQQRSLFEAAAREVVETLTPYFVAAQREGRPIPVGVVFDPSIRQWLQVYCVSALAALTGKEPEELTGEDTLRVLLAVLVDEGHRLPLEGPVPTAAQIFDNIKATHDKGSALLGVMPMMALAAFAKAEAPTYTEADVPDFGLGELTHLGVPPATRLHPHGPHAEVGRRTVLAFLTKRIAQVASELA